MENATPIIHSHAGAPVIHSHAALRGIAALCVFLGHLAVYGFVRDSRIYHDLFYWQGYAVDLFFLLSGFVMHWVYVARDAPITWGKFCVARAGRILPLYYLTTAVFLPISILSMAKHGLYVVGSHYPAILALNALGVSGIIDGWRSTINQPAWSISVEMLCYLAIFPALVLLHRRVRKWRSHKAAGAMVVIAATQIMVTCYSIPETIPGWNFTWFLRGVCGFISGFILCEIFKHLPRPGNRAVDAAVVILLTAFALTRSGALPEVAALYLWPLIVVFTAFDRGMILGWFRSGAWQWLGERSYSIYLWQFPVAMGYQNTYRRLHTGQDVAPSALHFAVIVVLVFLLADLSYRYFEMPARRWISGQRQERPAVILQEDQVAGLTP